MAAVSTNPQTNRLEVESAVRHLLEVLGCDLNSPGMRDTPQRVAKMWSELLAGYGETPEDILKRDFPSEGYDQMITLRNVTFHSLCEHHLLPFSGVASISYIPNEGRVVGLSKLARLVDCFARRFQIQERLTEQIATALDDQLQPIGAGVVLRATHLCMVCRGVAKPKGEMVTVGLRGELRNNLDARLEFLQTVWS